MVNFIISKRLNSLFRLLSSSCVSRSIGVSVRWATHHGIQGASQKQSDQSEATRDVNMARETRGQQKV